MEKNFGNKDTEAGADIAVQEENPQPKPTPTIEGKTPKPSAEEEVTQYHAAIIDTKNLVEAEARDAADAHMTESKEAREGNWFSRTAKRVWKHNIFQEYYRQKEITRVKKEILESDNLYAGARAAEGATMNDDEAMAGIVEKFTSEYESDMLSQEERDSRVVFTEKVVVKKLKDLIKEFARGNISEPEFRSQKNDILSSSQDDNLISIHTFADNLLDIARNVKEKSRFDQTKEIIAFDLKITLGVAEDSLNTKAHFSKVDKIVEEVQNSKLGKFVANETVASAVAIAVSASERLVTSTLNSKVAKWWSFGGTAVVGGIISGFKESARLRREQSQHARERATGAAKPDKNDPRRFEMENFIAETRSSIEVINNLSYHLDLLKNPNLTTNQLNEMYEDLAHLESQIELGYTRHVDFIAYSNKSQVIPEKNKIDVLRAKLKVELGKRDTDSKNRLAKEKELWSKDFANELDKKDLAFRRMKRIKVAKRMFVTAVVGGAIGFGIQEVASLFQDDVNGVVEGAMGEGAGSRATALEHARQWMTGEGMANQSYHTDVFSGVKLEVPDGIQIQDNGDGTMDLFKDGALIGDNVPVGFDGGGNFDPATRAFFESKGMIPTTSLIASEVSAQEYVDIHAKDMTRIHVDTWYDNDTAVSDQNELRLLWGGAGQSGVDTHGNYVFSVKNMVAGGSSHAGISADAAAKMAAGKLEMTFSLSRETRDMVFTVPVDTHGNIVITHDQKDLFEKLFTLEKGHAVFKGKFAHVFEPTSTDATGLVHGNSYATLPGPGIDTITTDTTHIKFVIPNDYDVPYPLPIIPRTPLEEAEYKKKQEEDKKNPKPVPPAKKTNPEGDFDDSYKRDWDIVPEGEQEIVDKNNVKIPKKTGVTTLGEEFPDQEIADRLRRESQGRRDVVITTMGENFPSQEEIDNLLRGRNPEEAESQGLPAHHQPLGLGNPSYPLARVNNGGMMVRSNDEREIIDTDYEEVDERALPEGRTTLELPQGSRGRLLLNERNLRLDEIPQNIREKKLEAEEGALRVARSQKAYDELMKGYARARQEAKGYDAIEAQVDERLAREAVEEETARAARSQKAYEELLEGYGSERERENIGRRLDEYVRALRVERELEEFLQQLSNKALMKQIQEAAQRMRTSGELKELLSWIPKEYRDGDINKGKGTSAEQEIADRFAREFIEKQRSMLARPVGQGIEEERKIEDIDYEEVEEENNTGALLLNERNPRGLAEENEDEESEEEEDSEEQELEEEENVDEAEEDQENEEVAEKEKQEIDESQLEPTAIPPQEVIDRERNEQRLKEEQRLIGYAQSLENVLGMEQKNVQNIEISNFLTLDKVVENDLKKQGSRDPIFLNYYQGYNELLFKNSLFEIKISFNRLGTQDHKKIQGIVESFGEMIRNQNQKATSPEEARFNEDEGVLFMASALRKLVQQVNPADAGRLDTIIAGYAQRVVNGTQNFKGTRYNDPQNVKVLEDIVKNYKAKNPTK